MITACDLFVEFIVHKCRCYPLADLATLTRGQVRRFAGANRVRFEKTDRDITLITAQRRALFSHATGHGMTLTRPAKFAKKRALTMSESEVEAANVEQLLELYEKYHWKPRDKDKGNAVALRARLLRNHSHAQARVPAEATSTTVHVYYEEIATSSASTATAAVIDTSGKASAPAAAASSSTCTASFTPAPKPPKPKVDEPNTTRRIRVRPKHNKPELTRLPRPCHVRLKAAMRNVGIGATKVVGAFGANLAVAIREYDGVLRELLAKCENTMMEERKEAERLREERKKERQAAGVERLAAKKSARQRSQCPVQASDSEDSDAEDASDADDDLYDADGDEEAEEAATGTAGKAKKVHPGKKWLTQLLSYTMRRTANYKGMRVQPPAGIPAEPKVEPATAADDGVRVDPPAGTPPGFKVEPAKLWAEESFEGLSHLIAPITRQALTDISNYARFGFVNGAIKFIKALAPARTSHKLIQAAARNDVDATKLLQLPRVCRELLVELRLLTRETDGVCRILRCWVLSNKLKDVRDEHVRKQASAQAAGGAARFKLPQIKAVPTGGCKRRFVEYQHAGMAQLLKKTFPEVRDTFSGLHDVFDWDGDGFKAEREDNLGQPTTIVSDGDFVHFRCEELVTRDRFKDGKKLKPKVYEWNGHYRIEKVPVDPPVMRTVAAVVNANFIGAVDAEDLAVDMFELPNTQLRANTALAEAKTRLQAEVTSDRCLGVDPGLNSPVTASNGRFIPLALCYQHNPTAALPKAVDAHVESMKAISIHVDGLVTLKANRPLWIDAHAKCVDYYARHSACSDRAVRDAERTSLVRRAVRDLLARKCGDTYTPQYYTMIAWGYNYRGGNTLRGVKTAGPSLVKAILRELCKHVLVLLGKSLSSRIIDSRCDRADCAVCMCVRQRLQWMST